MAHLQYFSYEGFGERVLKNTHYSQSVRVGDFIEIAGQGGWDRSTSKMPTDKAEEVDNAFDNVEVALKQAGGKGWSEVYKVRLYTAPDDAEIVQHVIRNLKKYCPDHAPALTGVTVAKLAIDGMRLEIEVTAHVKN